METHPAAELDVGRTLPLAKEELDKMLCGQQSHRETLLRTCWIFYQDVGCSDAVELFSEVGMGKADAKCIGVSFVAFFTEVMF
jgi:hypothetical protein